MESWKQNFAERLKGVQSHWINQFDQALDNFVAPAFDEVGQFVRNLGFRTAAPMHEQGCRSFKFELAENAYLLMIFRADGIGEFELRWESFAPGKEPEFRKSKERIADVDEPWSRDHFQMALDRFLEHLGGAVKPAEAELVVA